MKSTVNFYNPKRGMFSVLLENGEYSIIELLDSSEITIGDEIVGELEYLGSTQLKNVTTGNTFSVMIQNVHCDEHQAIKRVLLKY